MMSRWSVSLTIPLLPPQDHVTTLTSGLDAGPKGALNDVMKSLMKVASQNEPKEEEMDNSIVV